ncbi:hypothetical protein SD70_19205 [Gordoniibacillus kamchatkensis]|uniref:DUF2197 domain-containing protein n=1 Tax=Gordoniibacillus kamchatkensis TaxID=1590651 RepID=A0ABR5AG35_9BACL|nr:hypothetical protein [Paenibacillus sp. VKM B-2647]KIL39535.1 hypothetical protein SD70_19205 [Paenibacillus sp. VKM B-2647]
MTKAHESIYCIQCCAVKPRAEAELVFRTGFYRTTIPLGRCQICANAERTAGLPVPPQSVERECSSAQLA